MIRIIAAAALILASPVAAEPIVAIPAEQAQLDALKQPEDWFIAHLKGPREVSDRVALDARLQWVLENVTRPASVPAVQAYLRNTYATPEGRAATRTALDRYWALRTAPGPQMATEDRTVPGRDGNAIPIRIYRPDGVAKDAPVIVYYHGGGFMFGSIEAFDPSVRMIAAEAKAIVVSVGYRLAPEHPYPAAWNDAEDAYDWVAANRLSGGQIGLAGDSAGGTLAIATALRARDAKKPMAVGLLLFYPGVDRVNDYASMKTLGSGYGLDADNLKYLADQVYPEGVATTSADTSPMQADLCGLPAVRVVTAGFDPLKDSQAAFAAHLSAETKCKLDASHVRYGTLIHAFLQTTLYVPDADAAARSEAAQFGRHLRSN
ncbi:alpha/beta hydrolase fold family protein [Asticcacaulis biprosthecium C19]|uniref:Alpha/beta hydrolase fold family protein n=1 Tax=Asticcacaulis biprosthecium C19 TaxID=715226 RepID=F4QIH2_9CAUL|nr:alpha/beta hydrolase [Asticcacaulis biprosthecium]EGF92961.1 alpha/beta hydrolase fold family protein [Asticcacaulis biprosthecium C19]